MSELTMPAWWRSIDTGDSVVAVAERDALGTTARLVVWPPGRLDVALAAVDRVLAADANAAATAAIVAGERAMDWLAATGLPARLVSRDGNVQHAGGWPDDDGGRIEVPPGSHVYGAARQPGGVR